MKLSRFLTDENIDPQIVVWLRQTGCNVKDIKEEKLSGLTDKVILDIATTESRVVLTHDSDFGKIVFTDYTLQTGIIFLRPGHINAQTHLTSLKAIFDSGPELIFPFILVAENSGDKI